MFGSKFKTWMENHIVRPKRKSQQDKDKASQSGGGKGPILESSESLAQSDTGISSGSQQVLSSSNTDNNEGYCTTTMESNRSGMAHCHTAVNLSSPESAYSTGYSTDGTSPGGTGPPEYYINIRTGKHYFPSPAPTPTSPQPSTAFSQLYPGGNQGSFATNETALSSLPSHPSQLSDPQGLNSSRTPPACASRSSFFSNGRPPSLTYVPEQQQQQMGKAPAAAGDAAAAAASSSSEVFGFSKSPTKKVPPKSPLNTLKLFLKSPKQDKAKPKSEASKTPTLQNKKKATSSSSSSSPAKNKKWYKQPFHKFGHRRTDSASDEVALKAGAVKKELQFDRNFFYLAKENAASSPRQRNRIRTNPWLPTEPMSSQNFHSLQMNFSPNPVRNRSCTNTPLQNRKTSEVQVRLKDLSLKCDDGLEKAINRHIGQKLLLELSDHSEEDLTLNEMMGTYNESYVYEKETDILSDSDPTDCEDYVSDSEADNGGDEQDSHDDELDFIDDGSVVGDGDALHRNTGKCTYHDAYGKKGGFLSKSSRHHSRNESESRKSFKKDAGDGKKKRSKEDKSKKKSLRKPGRNPPEQSKAPAIQPIKIEPINMSKLIMQRANGKNGSKSADGTPVCLRRRKMIKELRETHIGTNRTTDGVKSPSLVNAVLEDDVEADKKYNQLILEAENMFVKMQNSPVVQSARRKMMEKEKDSLSVWRKTEALCGSKFPEVKKSSEATPRRNLGLSLAVDGKKQKEFNFHGKGSFKAKSSAHSPLDPLGPTFKNFTVFVDKKISSTSSDDSESSRIAFEAKPSPSTCVVPIAFQSVDLGKPLASYCPQSEPVKRKIYSCSKTYDKLVKRFENESKMARETRTRHASLNARKRCDSHGSAPPGRAPEAVAATAAAAADRPGCNFFYNPVYSPYASPVSGRKPCNVASPNVVRRFSYDVDAIR